MARRCCRSHVDALELHFSWCSLQEDDIHISIRPPQRTFVSRRLLRLYDYKLISSPFFSLFPSRIDASAVNPIPSFHAIIFFLFDLLKDHFIVLYIQGNLRHKDCRDFYDILYSFVSPLGFRLLGGRRVWSPRCVFPAGSAWWALNDVKFTM